MAAHTVKDGNAFYEIDEDCVERQERLRAKKWESEEKALRLQVGEQKRRKDSGKSE